MAEGKYLVIISNIRGESGEAGSSVRGMICTPGLNRVKVHIF